MGFLEDRRPASNLDPYLVLYRILSNVVRSEGVEEDKNGTRA